MSRVCNLRSRLYAFSPRLYQMVSAHEYMVFCALHVGVERQPLAAAIRMIGPSLQAPNAPGSTNLIRSPYFFLRNAPFR